MANRRTTFLLKRSNVPGKVPPASAVTSGEILLNTADAILYTSGSTANQILPIGWDRINRTGDTVTGNFSINGGLTANTISAATYQNLPKDVFVTGGTYSNGTATFTNNTGGTFNVSGFTATTAYNVDYIDFNTGATVTQSQGRISWDSGTGTLNIAVGDATTGLIDLQVGQEEIVRVHNLESTTLQKGEIVYVAGNNGNRPGVKRAQAQGDLYSVTTLGMVDRPIASGAEGYVTTFGIISNLNTIGLTGGTPIWLSPTTPGAYTSTKPIAPDHTVLIGYVIRVSATVGSIFINISNGWEIEELHDVRISGATTGDLLMRSTFNGSPVWVNTKTLNGSYTITGNTSIGGNLVVSGNTGVNWFSSNTSSDLVRITQTGSGNAFVVEDSTNPDSTPFVVDATGNVGIGTTSPISTLQVLSAPSGGEEVARFGVSDDTGSYFRILNGTGTVSTFIPTIEGVNSSTNIGLISIGNGATDTGGNAITVFDSRIGSSSATTRPTFQWRNFGNAQMTMTAGSNLGFGTVSPLAKFDVRDGDIFVYGITNRNSGVRFQYGAASSFWVNAPSGGTMAIGGTGGSAPSTGAINITSSGNVGIGTSSPTEKLNVSGNTFVSGSLSATTIYGDGSNITNIPNRLLSMTMLTASTLVTHTVGTTNFTAINLNSDATNRFAKTTFVAPPSGNVIIEMQFDMTIVNSAAVQMIGLNTTTGATSTPSEGWYRINADNDATSGQFYAKFTKTNLTPGVTYSYYFMGVCDFSGNTIRTSNIQTGAYSAGSDLPSPLRIMVYDLGNITITTNPSS